MNALDGEDFSERPVEIETFVQNEEYLNLPPLSEDQYILIRASSQIYKKSTLDNLFRDNLDKADKRWGETMNEIIFQLGKGTMVKESMVYSPDFGYKPVAELLDNYEWQAETLEGNDTATEFFTKGFEDVYKVTTRKGYTSTYALEHNALAWKISPHGFTYTTKKPPIMMALSELEVGDLLAIKRGWTEIYKENWYDCTPDEARVIGYMVGDGTWMRNVNGRPSRNACFTNATEEVQNDFIRTLSEAGGKFKNYLSGMGCWAVRVNGINSWMIKHGLVHDYNQKKPWNYEWMKMSDECLGQLVNGMWATDGWVHIQSRPGMTSVVAAIEFNSESLARGLQAALLRLGVVSKFKHHRLAVGAHSDTFRIEVTSIAGVLRLLEMTGDIVGKEDVCAEVRKIAKNKGKTADQPGVFADRIASIEYVGREEIFTCSVDESHQYLADGMVHGNSGKDYCSSIACAYVVYLLLCLKDPARYYGKPPGDQIAILNIAINAAQAQNTFFKYFKQRITSSPWFQGKYEVKAGEFSFIKNVFVYSGHSEREAWEGYNLIFVILDEISGFALESSSGNENAKTALNVYRMYKQSVTSRFAEFGKVLLLSFPRFKNDFIQQRYNAVVLEKEVVVRTHTFKINDGLPDGEEENEFTIEWDEDHIVAYEFPKVFALKRPSWEVNPIMPLESLKIAFYDDPIDSLSRFACVAAGERVWTSSGLVPIEDVRVHDIINSNSGGTRITNKWSSQKECLEITYKNGQTLVCTEDHGILKVGNVRGGNNPDGVPFAKYLGKYATSWARADELRVGDSTLGDYDSSGLFGNNQLTEEQAYILGLVITDGWVRNDDTRRYIGIACGTSRAYAESVAEVFSGAFGECHIRENRPDSRLADKIQYSVQSGVYSAVQWVEDMGVVPRLDSNQKRVPHAIYSAPEKSILAFVSGMVDGDGSINNAGNITFVNTSEKMLKDLQELLCGLGCRSVLGMNTRVASRREGVIKSNYDLWGLRLNKYDSLILRPRLNLLSGKNNKPRPTPFAVEGGKGIYQKLDNKITSIKRVGVRTVYDITTRNHTFTVKGTVVHNCMPPDMEGAFFKSREKVEHAFCTTNGVDEFGVFSPDLKPDPTKEYFIHVDLARLHDRCAVSMAHVDRWERKQMGVAHITEPAPIVIVDAIRYWTPKANKAVDFIEVREYIVSLRARGFNIRLTTFDRWESYDMMEYLKSVGMRTEKLSVALAHYTDLQVIIAGERLVAPSNSIVVTELLELRIDKNGKIDHPRKGGKDLADATCGAVYNAISHTRRDAGDEIDILTIEDIRRRVVEEAEPVVPSRVVPEMQFPISAPKGEMPAELEEFLINLRVIGD